MLSTKNKNFVGIDIGADSIKIVCLKKEGGKPVFKHSIIDRNPVEIFDGARILNPGNLGTRLKDILNKHNIQAAAAACALPAAVVFTKKFYVPISVSKSKLNKLMAEEAQKCIPYDINAVNYDCQICGIANNMQVEVLVVAVKHDVVSDYIEVFKQAGLELSIIDVASFALEKAFSFNYPDIKDQHVVLINVGHRSTEMVVMYRGKVLSYPDCEVGGKLYVESLAEVFQITLREADAVFRGEVDNVYDKNLYQQTVDNVTKHIAAALIDKLKKQQPEIALGDIDVVYLTGGGVTNGNLLYEFSIKSNLSCLQMYALKNIPVAKTEGPTSEPDKKSLTFIGVAVGLALRLSDEE